jgi:uncharacterized protein (TIGR03089 family)
MSRIAWTAGDTVADLWGATVDTEPARPVLTWYDDATGERTELSGATLDNWVAKTANLLVDGCGLGPGSAAAVALPPHWQTAAVLLGCWAAGLAIASPDPAEVIFSTEPVDSSAPDRYLLGLAPMGLPLRAVPAGWQDYVTAVRGYGDRFVAAARSRPDDPALCGETHRALLARARDRAAALGISGRVLIDAARYPDPVDWLLAPLTAGSSIVLCGHLDPATLPSRQEAERVTATLTG